MTRTLRDLLSTWENWTRRDTLRRAISATRTEESRARLTAGLADVPEASALEALRDATELVALLAGWRWQAVHAARVEEGATWEQIAQASGVGVEQARADYAAAIERMERAGVGDVAAYRRAL